MFSYRSGGTVTEGRRYIIRETKQHCQSRCFHSNADASTSKQDSEPGTGMWCVLKSSEVGVGAL